MGDLAPFSTVVWMQMGTDKQPPGSRLWLRHSAGARLLDFPVASGGEFGPGLAVLPSEDHYVGTEQMRRRAAERAGARIELLDGLGHWWMVQDPARAAEVITRFWASVPG